jgi:predicted DNA-binding transcriptional regulator YafY
MPTLDFTNDELVECAMALRAAAHRAMQDAAAMAQASRDYGFADTVRRYEALAARFEAARL